MRVVKIIQKLRKGFQSLMSFAKPLTDTLGKIGGKEGIKKTAKTGAKGLLGGVARKAGPIAAGLFGLYDAYQGFTADAEAGFVDSIQNAGSSVLSGLTFGLLGKSAEEIKNAASQPGTGATPSTVGVNDFSIRANPKDTLVMAGGSKFGDEQKN